MRGRSLPTRSPVLLRLTSLEDLRVDSRPGVNSCTLISLGGMVESGLVSEF